ncbi:MAG: TetR family transcriptional regulator [Kofleriaceae bacterium]|nr:TetR family transcriptional regulator [Kofleriaceae bacterium]
MARPREFVADDVVAKAATAFWLRGFHALSVDDVLSTIGIGRQSFYNAFGDKRALLGLCLVRYREQQLTTFTSYFASRPTVAAGFTALFESLLAEPDAHKRRGCLILNTAVELAASDVDIADLAAAYQVAIEDLFAAQLARTVTDDNSAMDDARRKARLLVAIYLGLRMMAKADPRSTAIADAIKLAINQVTEFVGTQTVLPNPAL